MTRMRRSSKTSATVIIVLSVSLGVCAPAQAYVDPNAGGLLFQLLTPIIAVMAAALTFASKQLLRFWESVLAGMKALATRLFRT
jgi:hypothetical protein